MCFHMIRCRHQIFNIRGEIGVGKIAFAGSQAGKVEAQNCKTPLVQHSGNTGSRINILGTGKTMSKERKCPDLAIGFVQPSGKEMALTADKTDAFSNRHHQDASVSRAQGDTMMSGLGYNLSIGTDFPSDWTIRTCFRPMRRGRLTPQLCEMICTS